MFQLNTLSKTCYLKLGCVLSGLMVSSQILSSVGIQLVARWQFCSTTHVPSLMALSIIWAAMGPCPCPREMVWVLLPPISRSSANFSKPEEIKEIRTSSQEIFTSEFLCVIVNYSLTKWR